MPGMRKRKTAQFRTQGSDGKMYIVERYTDFTDAGDFENPNDEQEGVSYFQTRDGLLVHHISKGEYQIVDTDIILRSTDPSAP